MIVFNPLLYLVVILIVLQSTVNTVPIDIINTIFEVFHHKFKVQLSIEEVQDEQSFASNTTNNLCTTTTCNHAASVILKNMDMSVDPCQDFYKFACGGFSKNTDIPENETHISLVTLLEQKIQNQLKESLESPISEELKFFKSAQVFYKSCMNTTAIEQRGIEPFRNILKKLGGWPVVEGEMWNENNFHWIESIHKCRQIGYSLNNFMNFGIYSDLKNNIKFILELDKVVLDIGLIYSNALLPYMMDIAVMLGAPENNATAKEIWETIRFQRRLVEITLWSEQGEDIEVVYNPMTLANLSTHFPSIPWKKYFNNILAPNVTINDDDVINVKSPIYISKFEKLINNTSKRIQANYVIWKAITESIVFLPKQFSDRQMEFLTKIGGHSKEIQRWKQCIEEVKKFTSVHALYARKYSNTETKKNIIDMVDYIKNQFIKTLQTIDWMDDATRKSALDKIDELSAFAAYPDELLDNDKLKETNENDLILYEDKFMENYLNLQQFTENDLISYLRKSVDKNYWMHHITTTMANLFYLFSLNTIDIPAGALQGFLFHPHRPKYMNYGMIGSLIGHEFTHVFDMLGRRYDKYGNLNNWWTSEADEAFKRKAKCIINQYDNYTVEQINTPVNGFATLNENIADNTGYKLAYLAYKKWISVNGEEPRLPGLSFDSQQLFWISAANTFCSKERNQTLRHMIYQDNHSPHQFRVNGPFSNIEAFAKDFNCPVGSKMNPTHKCSIY